MTIWGNRSILRAMHSDFAVETKRVADRVRSLSASCPFGFWFLTDLHVPSNNGVSADLIARLSADTGVRTVVCGGDIPEAFGDRASLDRSIERYRLNWADAIERAGCDFFPIHGNHDFTIRAAPDSDDGFTLPASRTREILLDTAAVRARAETHEESCAYFADLPEAKSRLVVTDCSDSVTSERRFWAVQDGMSKSQVLWLAGRALADVPDGWNVVVAGHEPLAGVGATDAERELFAPLRAVVEAYAARSAATVFGRTFDYSGARGRLFLSLSGHHHAELQSSISGIWHVTEPCDAAYLDYINRSMPWCPALPEKKPGTWAGQTFDAVQIDPERSIVHFTRVGGGTDRTLHASPRILASGEKTDFSSALSSSSDPAGAPVAAQWGAYDSLRAHPRPNPARKYDFFTDYDSTVGRIFPDGVFEAVSPGDATVVATLKDGSREYFQATVRA